MTERLTTLVAVKDWLDINSSDSDAQLTRLIEAASQFVLNWIDRGSFQVRTYTQNFKGNGKCSTLLRNWPVVSVSSVGAGGVLIPASVLGTAGLPGSGYVVSDDRGAPQSIDLYGYSFPCGSPSQVIYTSGFRTTDTSTVAQPQSPATTVTYAPQSTGQWLANVSVTLNGTAAVEVEGDPTIGEYAVDAWGVYLFSGDDAGKTAVITYDYVPMDVSWAVTEMVGEVFKRKDRIGVNSKSLGGQETVSFSPKDMSDFVRSTLQPYVNVIPA